jgi:hypothetical protein
MPASIITSLVPDMPAEEIPWYVSLIVSWLPFLALLALASWIGRKIRKALRADDGRSVGQVIDDLGREARRTNELLQQMVHDHRARLEALERKP